MATKRPLAYARACVHGAMVASAVLVCLASIAVGVGAAVGYRPVVIQTGSMGATAPPGSLVVVRPERSVDLGDVLVMQTAGRATVTHRVVGFEQTPDGPTAVTQGDANPDVDPQNYRLGTEELTARWVVPSAGGWLASMRSPTIGLAVLLIVVAAFCIIALRRIWRTEPRLLPPPLRGSMVSADFPLPGAQHGDRIPTQRERRWRRTIIAATAVGAIAVAGGSALSLYIGVDTVTANSFSTLPCFDARLGLVQKGQHTSATNGTTSIPIGTVDPAKSFLVFSASSNSNEPDESIVMGELASSTSIEFTRTSNGAPPADIVVEWSVVEYDCGVSVQRGITTSTGAATVDTAINSIDPTSSFALLSSSSTAGASDFGGDQMRTVELVDDTTLRMTSSTSIPAGVDLAWQVVTFDAGDASTQQMPAALANGVGTTMVTLSSTVDVRSSAVFASARWAGSGVDIGDRAVRVRLVDGDTVEVTRSIADGQIDVVIQVVEFTDGTTVRHGVIDLPAAQTTATVPIPPVQPSRSTVLSTVQTPSSSSGGSTAASTDDVIGEASARMRLADPRAVELTRGASSDAASFAWQVITWNGPSWANPDEPFRRRIDVEAGTVIAPDGYTTSLTIDHGSLVTEGLSTISGDDIQIWYHNGVVWSEAHRVLDDGSSWNASDTTIRFRTRDTIDANDTGTYWLYFGDDTPAAPLDDPAQVYLTVEGFDDGTLGAFEDRTGGSAWYDDDPWTRRIVLDIDATGLAGPVTDRPVLVRVTDADLTANAQIDGSDFRFTAADATTALAHQVEEWDPASSTLTAWVRVPSIAAGGSTTIHLYYGSPSAPDQSDARSTWAGETAAWLLAADPATDMPALDDDSSNQRDGVALADAVAATTPSGPGVELDGTLDRLESQPFALADAPFTVTAFVRADTLLADATIAGQGNPLAAGVFDLRLVPGGTPTAEARLRVDGAAVTVTGGTISTGSWHHLAATWDRSTLTLYVDGAAVASVPASGNLPSAGAVPVVIGADAAGSNALDGTIGHVQISSSSWSVADVQLASNGLRSPGAAVSASAATAVTAFEQGTWTTRWPLVVDAEQVAGPLTDYPLLVEFTDVAVGATAQVSGDDFVLTAADGVTRLDHMVESWDHSTGSLTAWVRIPTLPDTADSTIYLYAGNASAADQQDIEALWGGDADLLTTNSS